MCTALSITTKDHYFGRNLDLDRSYGEEVCVMPRQFPLSFRKMGEMPLHFAMMGMATVAEGIPLFYEAANEHGLSMAGLNFPGNACYHPLAREKDNVAPFELIPWILGQCKNLEEAEVLLDRINLADIAFSEGLPLSPLHWMLSDGRRSLVVESMTDGLHIYPNPAGVLTNNPPFEYQLVNLQQYCHLRADSGHVVRIENLPHMAYSQGLGAIGLPGDVSSMSRFVRMVFGRENAVREEEEMAAVTQFFHLLASVQMIRGLCRTDEGSWDITGYSACINASRGLYYYTTYGNRQISCVDMHRCDLDSRQISRFPLLTGQSIRYQN